MNDEFNKQYLTLLRRQVEEEIHYLNTNGHDNEVIYTPCMFCIERPNSSYVCRRLIDLKQFLSSIMSHGSSKLRTQHERKRIGFAEPIPEVSPREGTFNLRSDLNLPLLSTKFQHIPLKPPYARSKGIKFLPQQTYCQSQNSSLYPLKIDLSLGIDSAMGFLNQCCGTSAKVPSLKAKINSNAPPNRFLRHLTTN